MTSKLCKADIFIPTSNRYDSLKLCLDSLNNQSNKEFKVLLVGLKPDLKIQQLVESYKNLQIDYFIQKDKGIINAGNKALQKSTCEIFVRSDDDVIFDKNWFNNLIIRFESDKNIGGVTGPTCMSKQGIKSRDLTNFLDNFKKSKNILLKLISRLYFNYLYENKINHVSTFLKSGVFTLGSNYESCLNVKDIVVVNHLEACNFSVRTSLLKQVNGFDLIYLKGLGDYHEADTAMKIKNLGYKLVFDPKVMLQHNVEVGVVQKSRPNSYYRIQNFIIFYFRFFKIKDIDQLFRFLTNLSMQNFYYIFKFFSTKDVSQLYAIFGTFVGFYRVFVLKQHLINK